MALVDGKWAHGCMGGGNRVVWTRLLGRKGVMVVCIDILCGKVII